MRIGGRTWIGARPRDSGTWLTYLFPLPLPLPLLGGERITVWRATSRSPTTRSSRQSTHAPCGEDSRDNGKKLWFEIDRAKTERDALATLSKRTQALVRAYVSTRPATVSEAPIFVTRRGAEYTKNSLGKDFRVIRKLLFPGDTRQLQDMRRTGAVEAQSGGADLSVIS